MKLLNIARFGIGIVSLFMVSFVCADEASIRMQTLLGKDINSCVKDITDLSLTIYREFPYLYEGTEEEYMPFIQHYAESDNGIACVLFDNDKPIGVAIGMPIKEMRENYQQPLLNSPEKINMDSMFYLGEFLLLAEYRGKDLGKQMYMEFERLVQAKRNFSSISFCKIVEFDNHPHMPSNYKPLDGFWRKLGFEQKENINFSVLWQNVGEAEYSPHKLVYWIKSL